MRQGRALPSLERDHHATIATIAVVSVFVRDEGTALAFSTNALGFELRADRPMGPGQRWLEAAPPGAATRLVLDPVTAEMGADQLGQFASIVFEPDDIDATYVELSARGVEFVAAPTDQPWGGRQAPFKDQDGNVFAIVQR